MLNLFNEFDDDKSRVPRLPKEERPLFINTNTTHNPNKRVCITNGEVVMKVTRSLAEKMIAESNTWKYTSKSKLKCFLAREKKLHNNKATIDTYGTEGGHINDPDTGKSYSNVPTYKIIHKFSRGIKVKPGKALKKMYSPKDVKVKSSKMLHYTDMNMKDFLEGLSTMPLDRKMFPTGRMRVITRYN